MAARSVVTRELRPSGGAKMRTGSFFAIIIFCLNCADNSASAADFCQMVRDSSFARVRVPYRTEIDTTAASKKPIHSEEVYTRDAWYRKFNDRWMRTATSPQAEVDGMKKIDAVFSNCSYVGDGTIDGEAVSIYYAKTRNLTVLPFTGDEKVWISKKRGLPLRSEAHASAPFLGTSFTVKVFTYDNVKPPI